MHSQLVNVRERRWFVANDAGGSEQAVVTVLSGDTLYYGDQHVTSTNHEGTLAVGDSLTLDESKYFVSATQTIANLEWTVTVDAFALPSDGARSILTYGGGPDQSAERNQAAAIDATARARDYDGGGCVDFGVGRIIIQPDATFQPASGVTWRGVRDSTILQSSEYETTALFTTAIGGWTSHDIIYDGARDQSAAAPGTGPSIIVLNTANSIEFRGSLRNPFNNGIVARGPGIANCTFVAEGCFGSGAGFTHGGGHMIALTGDGLDLPFDVTNCVVRLRGHDINNGGVNVGSTNQCHVEVIVWNDYTESIGPSNTGVAALRLANGSRSCRGYVIAHGTGRGLRIGPCDDIQLSVWAKHTAFEAVLLAGGPYSEGGWRGGSSRLDITQINCNMLAGGDGTRAKSHAGTTVTIDSANIGGSTSLSSTLVIKPATDDDLAETRTVGGVNAYWDKFVTYRWKIVDHSGDPTQIDVTVVREVEGYDVTVATFTCGQNNDQFVTALMASAWVTDSVNGRAYIMNGSGLAMQRSTNGRNGPMDHRLRIGDIGMMLGASLNAGEVTSTLTPTGDQSQGSAVSIAYDPSGETYYPFIGEIRDVATNRREVVRFDSSSRRLGIAFGPPTGGVVNLIVNHEAVAIPYNASAGAAQTLLSATRAGQAGVTVTGGPLPDSPITFSFTQNNVSVSLSATNGLIGGFNGLFQAVAGLNSITFGITRAQRGTSALAWDTTATVYCHPSDIYDLGGRSDRTGTDSVNASTPSTLCKVDTDAVRTSESNLRGITSGTLFPPLGLREVHVTTASTTIDWITGRMMGRRLTVVADVDGVVLSHGTGNLKMAGQRNLTLNTGQSVEMKCDANADQWEEVGVNYGGPRTVAVGNTGTTVTTALVPGDREVIITATLTGNVTWTLTGLKAGMWLTLYLTQDGTGSRLVTFSPAAKAPGGALGLSTTAGAKDIVRLHYDGTNLNVISVTKAIA